MEKPIMPRKGWDKAMKLMHENGDDVLLDLEEANCVIDPFIHRPLTIEEMHKVISDATNFSAAKAK